MRNEQQQQAIKNKNMATRLPKNQTGIWLTTAKLEAEKEEPLIYVLLRRTGDGMIDGITLGSSLGIVVGLKLGTALGTILGIKLGTYDGDSLGKLLGILVGNSLGKSV
jgi:hypothetical protein